NMDENIVLHINVLFFGGSFYKYIQPVNRKIDIMPSDLYSGILLKENDYLEQNAAIFTVYNFRSPEKEFANTRVDSTLDLKKHFEEKDGKKIVEGPKKEVISKNITEVDLHIHHIVDDYNKLSNAEIVDIQMARFKTSLDTAIIHKTRRIVFIHGVGNGKLKFEIRKSLDKDYADLKYQDASFKEYGYGATMVMIPQ
ncbi:MAG: Smr/MutS family protein, partial [Bacteroidales bacterium]|nr:Smr/MutS family protein [Bacteroidales bacterium]